jgi:deoxyadenosine/deoxycytidine kinase|uniref:Deoxynucleoside kinase n=1 Tax=candidate division WOR-3 bacterium TaxID=2052148 RepID=A0A7C6AEN9_UNCW3
MRELRFIAIEGVIGAGKTTLAKELANKFHAGLILEEFEENPFLAKFYSNPSQYAFHTQLYFLMSRYRQQRKINQMDLFHSRLISDYLFAKDRIFAEVNLTEEEFSLYDKIYALIEKEIPRPDVVVYLQSTPDFLYKRIKQRDRSYERNIEYDYLVKLCEAYNSFFIHYNTSQLLVVNIKGFDFLTNTDLDLIYKEIIQLKVPRKIISKE